MRRASEGKSSSWSSQVSTRVPFSRTDGKWTVTLNGSTQNLMVNWMLAMEKKVQIIPGFYEPAHWMTNTQKSKILLWMLSFIGLYF